MPFPILPLIYGGAALGGGLMSLFGHRKKPQTTQIQRFSPQQQSALNQLLSQGMANADFGPIEQRARSQFSSQTVPSLAERFTAMGGGGRQSSGFMGELGLAGSDLESQLASLRSQFGMNQLQMGLTPQFESMVEPGGPGMMQSLGMNLMSGAMGGLPSALQYHGLQQQQGYQKKQDEIRNKQIDELMKMLGGGGGQGYMGGGVPYFQGAPSWLS